MRPLILTLLCAGMALLFAPVAAETQISPGEMALLPEWCIDSQAGPYGGPQGHEGLNRSPRARQWVSLMGTDFWNMHHYCYGLLDIVRLGGALTPVERTFLIDRAIKEFNYVISTCKPSMPLLPEVFLKRGEMQARMGDLVSAIDSFDASRKLKLDYWPAYDRWLGLLIGLKQYDRASALVKEGLAASPEQPNLVARQKAIQAALRATAPRRLARPTAAASAAATRQ